MKSMRKIWKFKLDQWLEAMAADAGIEGGQGRSGAATLFSALLMTGGILTIAFLGGVIILARTVAG